MKVISDADDLDFEIFDPAVRQRFKAKPENGLPPWGSALRADDALAAFRMIGVVRHEPLSITYEQVGEALERLYGKPIAGLSLDQLYNDGFREKAYEGYRRMIQARSPVSRNCSRSIGL